MPSYDRALDALRTWMDSWAWIGHVAVGIHDRAHQDSRHIGGREGRRVTDQQQPEIDARRQTWPAHRFGVKAGALAFGEIVESMLP
jgi:hypothetical protein